MGPLTRRQGERSALNAAIVWAALSAGVLAIVLLSQLLPANVASIKDYLGNLRGLSSEAERSGAPFANANLLSVRWSGADAYVQASDAYVDGSIDDAIVASQTIDGIDCYFLNLANRAFALGEYDEAAAWYQPAMSSDDRACSDSSQSAMLRNLCTLSIQGEVNPGADSWCQQAARRHPSIWTYLDWGRELYYAGQYEEALKAFRRAQEQDTTLPALWMWTGRAYLGLRDVESARSAFLTGLVETPLHAGLNYELGRIAQREGSLADAACYYAVAADDAGSFGAGARSGLAEIAPEKCVQKP